MILRGIYSSWGIGERKTPKSPQYPNGNSPKLLKAIYKYITTRIMTKNPTK